MSVVGTVTCWVELLLWLAILHAPSYTLTLTPQLDYLWQTNDKTFEHVRTEWTQATSSNKPSPTCTSNCSFLMQTQTAVPDSIVLFTVWGGNAIGSTWNWILARKNYNTRETCFLERHYSLSIRTTLPRKWTWRHCFVRFMGLLFLFVPITICALTFSLN